MVPLEGGMTNRNYRVQVGDVGEDVEIYVLRLAGRNTASLGIDRECEVACSRAAADLGLGPEVVAFLPEFGALLRRFVPGAILTPEAIRRPEVLRQLADVLRRLH